ncbi:MAG: P1 family peptidase [Candidatus Sericytochromatia bacterium]|nr:P1 family peptidase [Candidatus Tanganyikabacteria bacterium]
MPAVATPSPRSEARARLRDLGIVIGRYPPGKWNAITDVAGVKVGHKTVIKGKGKLVPGKGPARTGVTAIVPRDDVWNKKVFAGSFVLNGNGELTALNWVREAGWLETPILLTDTLSVGRVADAMVSWMNRTYPDHGIEDDVVLPMVGECDDGYLNDQQGRHVREADVFEALDRAATGPVAEGAVGAGTGMISYRHKAGIGTASRKLPAAEGGWTVGVLVNANIGRQSLVLAGVPVGEEIKPPGWKAEWGSRPRRGDEPREGSIIVVVATDAPLLPHQLDRVAKRAAMGIPRTGSPAHHGSGDLVVAFSTANVVPHYPPELTMPVTALNNTRIDPLFEAAAEAAEEAIGNSLTMATTTEGRDGHIAHALPLARLREVMKKYGRLK